MILSQIEIYPSAAAESVANALVTGFGIAPDRLVPFGVSYAAPVAPNTTAEGKSQNRRVELVRY